MTAARQALPGAETLSLEAALARLDAALGHLETAARRQHDLRLRALAELDGALRQLDGLIGEKQS